MNLYAHQSKIIEEDPKKTGLWLGTGSGKSRIALLLARGNTLVICPKTQKEDGNWEREWLTLFENGGYDTSVTVISKETFRRDWETLPKFDTIIIDEAHTVLGVTPTIRQRKRVQIPKASQLFESIDSYLTKYPPKRLYLATATIMKSPFTVWAAGKLLQHPSMQYDMKGFYSFRYQFYTKLPMPGREVWAPKRSDEVKDELAAIVRDLGYVGRLEDFFDVPDQTFRTEYVTLSVQQRQRIKELKMEYPEPIVRIGKQHQVENGVLSGDEFNAPEFFGNEKNNRILELAAEFPRMVIFARYRAQIEQIKTKLEHDGYKVLTLTGDTKDRGLVLQEANESASCIFIAQCQVSAGWELPEFPVMIFASRDYSFVNYDQAIGRIQRANNIKKNLYINLVVKGGIDEAVDSALSNKVDFNEHLYT